MYLSTNIYQALKYNFIILSNKHFHDPKVLYTAYDCNESK